MPILFAETKAAIVSSDQFVDIPGLVLDLPASPDAQARHALIILNVAQPYATGNDFPGIDFGILVHGQMVASGGFTYPMKQPESFARVPCTLVVRIDRIMGQISQVRAQWKGVRGSTGRIDSFASISAVFD